MWTNKPQDLKTTLTTKHTPILILAKYLTKQTVFYLKKLSLSTKQTVIYKKNKFQYETDCDL